MFFININSNSNNKYIDRLNVYIKQGKQIFILFYMDGCGPCNETLPEWKKIRNILEKEYKENNNIVVADVEQKQIVKLKNIPTQPKGFPTMIYISNYGKNVEEYENSKIERKDRKIDSFIEWIKSHTKKEKQSGGKGNQYGVKRKTMQKGGKWSAKYKKSISCKNPKGFSQRQYCKYGRKKGGKTRKMK